MSARSPSRAGTIARVALLNTVRTVLRADVHPRATVVEPHVHVVPAPAHGDHGDRGNDDQGPANLLHGGLRRLRTRDEPPPSSVPGRIVATPAGRQQSHWRTPADVMRQPSEDSGGQS